IGTGLLKGNVSVIVGQLYTRDDPRRDAGFSIFYMGINLGAFIAPLVCGYVGQRIDWHAVFATAGVGMVAGLIQYSAGGRYLGDVGLHPTAAGSRSERETHKRTAVIWTAGITVVLIAFAIAAYSGTMAVTATQVADAAGFCL